VYGHVHDFQPTFGYDLTRGFTITNLCLFCSFSYKEAHGAWEVALKDEKKKFKNPPQH
jgi:hypothetical protein